MVLAAGDGLHTGVAGQALQFREQAIANAEQDGIGVVGLLRETGEGADQEDQGGQPTARHQG